MGALGNDVVGQSKASVGLSTHRNGIEVVCPERRISETGEEADVWWNTRESSEIQESLVAYKRF